MTENFIATVLVIAMVCGLICFVWYYGPNDIFHLP